MAQPPFQTFGCALYQILSDLLSAHRKLDVSCQQPMGTGAAHYFATGIGGDDFGKRGIHDKREDALGGE